VESVTFPNVYDAILSSEITINVAGKTYLLILLPKSPRISYTPGDAVSYH
jgi:hypothetical protein